MHHTIKNFVGVAVIISLFLFGIAAVFFARSYDRAIDPSSFGSFSARGEGEVVAVPDVAQFSFTVMEQGGTDITALQQNNTKKMNEAIAFVKSKGVADKDIKTRNYNLNPRYQHFRCRGGFLDGGAKPCPPPEIVGYTISQSVLVKVRDFANIGGILSGVVESGANSVSGLSFTIDDPEAVENEARAEAIAKAKKKAQSIAKAGGFQLGKLLSIEEGFDRPVFRAFDVQSAGLGGAEAAPAPAIEPGSQEVKVSVTLRYEIR